VVASTFGEYLAAYVADLESGQYRLDDYGTVERVERARPKITVPDYLLAATPPGVDLDAAALAEPAWDSIGPTEMVSFVGSVTGLQGTDRMDVYELRTAGGQHLRVMRDRNLTSGFHLPAFKQYPDRRPVATAQAV